MGTFYHEMQVLSANGDRVETFDALADTGASYSQVPGSLLRGLGISPTDTVEAELADGRIVEDPIAEVRVRIAGLETFTWVTFGPENVPPYWALMHWRESGSQWTHCAVDYSPLVFCE